MQKRRPSTGAIVAMVVFAASCVGIATFLWISFGGTVPLKPRSYQMNVRFPKAFSLPEQVPVRQAGVDVGRVVKLRPTRGGTLATLELRHDFAPIHRDARAVLRTKSAAGETFVAITPGTRHAPLLPDGARLANRNVETMQTIEDVLQIFDPATRRRFRTWQQSTARAVRGRGGDLNASLAQLPDLSRNATTALSVLDEERPALGRLTRNSATVFDALSADSTALRQTVRSFDTTFTATASEDRALTTAIARFPAFLRTSRATLRDLAGFAHETDPVVVQLKPALRELSPALADTRALSPDLRRLFQNLGPAYTAARAGLPATSRVLRGARPVLAQLGPFLAQANPVFKWLELNQTTTSDFFSQGLTALASKTPARNSPLTIGHYLRQVDPGGAEAVAINPQRLPGNRGNAYTGPLDLGNIWQSSGISPSFDCRNAGGEKPATATSPACLVSPRKLLQGKRQGYFPHVASDDYRHPTSP